MNDEPSVALRKWDALPDGQRHPKNLAILAKEHVDLPHPVRAIVLQDAAWWHRTVTVRVEIPDGPVCEVELRDADDPASLATRIAWAGEMVLDAERRRQRPWHGTLWADEHPGALQELVDPTIRLTGLEYVWGLPAGWVPIMNRLHVDLAVLLGEYRVTTAGNKLSFLRVGLDRYGRDEGPDIWRAVNDRIRAVREESLRTCDLCGGPTVGTVSFGVTRCPAHPLERDDGGLGATARPPGWRTPRWERQ